MLDNKNKTYEIGNFKLIRKPNITNNGAEFKRLIDELSAIGYSEVKNELTESEDMLLGKDKTNWGRSFFFLINSDYGYKFKKDPYTYKYLTYDTYDIWHSTYVHMSSVLKFQIV